MNIFSKIKCYLFFVILIPHSQAHEIGGYKYDVGFFKFFYLFSYPLLEINNHKTQKIILGHHVTLTLTFTLRYLKIFDYLNNFVERIGGPQFLSDFDETWSDFFGRSISRISTVHFFWFLPCFFYKVQYLATIYQKLIFWHLVAHLALLWKNEAKNKKSGR